MNATILFYRYARANGLIGCDAPLWQDRQVVHRFHDANGFERTMLLSSTDLAIPNRARPGLQLEDGLLPLTRSQKDEMLGFTEQGCNASREIDAREHLGFCLLDREGLARLSKLAPTHEARQTPYIPPRIWLYQLSRMRECLEDYAAHRAEIEACFELCIGAYARNFGSLKHSNSCLPYLGTPNTGRNAQRYV
jgi:hypothetical protein